MIEGTGKYITVKKWFADKIANEVKRNINMCDVFCILKETDKAIYAMLNLGTFFRKTMWIPKSVLVEEDLNDENSHKETITTADYERAVEEFNYMWKMYV